MKDAHAVKWPPMLMYVQASRRGYVVAGVFGAAVGALVMHGLHVWAMVP